MGESRTGFWATIVLLLIVAVVFIVLWFMRGGEIDTLKQTLSQEQRFRADDVSRLESNLSSVQFDFDSTRRRLDETTSQLESERTRANQARQEADRLSREQFGRTGAAVQLENEINALKDSLAKEQTAKAELENRAATAEAALIAARKGLEDELTDLRTDVQIKRGAIENLVRQVAQLEDQLKTASAAAATGDETGLVAQLRSRLDELTANNTSLTERLDAVNNQVEATSSEKDKLVAELTASQGATAAVDSGAAERLAPVNRQLQERTAAAEAADRRLEEMERRLEYSTHLEDSLTKLNEEMAVIRSDRDQSVEAMSKLQTEYDKQLAAEKAKAATFAERLTAYQGKASILEDRLGEMTSMVEEYKQVYGNEPPVRQVGEVVDAMYNNKTVVINVGGNQRVKPGMKFDVYRPAGDRNRYLGMVRVVKVNADTALAISSFRAERVMVCPVTGFAVLEPGARFSPYAKGKDGKPIELVEMDSLEIPVEAPGIGDILSSPFYSPEKAFSFAVQDPDAFPYGEAQLMIDTLGGIYRAWQSKDAVDFAVVSGDKADTGDLKGNAIAVTADYVKRYYEPLVVETVSQPCVICP